METLEDEMNVKFPKDLASQETKQFCDKLCVEHKVECKEPRTTARLLDKLVGHFIESKCLSPAFVCEHPQIMSPLAKYHRSKDSVTERFEVFVNYQEIANAYTELNNAFK